MSAPELANFATMLSSLYQTFVAPGQQQSTDIRLTFPKAHPGDNDQRSPAAASDGCPQSPATIAMGDSLQSPAAVAPRLAAHVRTPVTPPAISRSLSLISDVCNAHVPPADAGSLQLQGEVDAPESPAQSCMAKGLALIAPAQEDGGDHVPTCEDPVAELEAMGAKRTSDATMKRPAAHKHIVKKRPASIHPEEVAKPGKVLLGCTRCRGAKIGCLTCRNPHFAGQRFQR